MCANYYSFFSDISLYVMTQNNDKEFIQRGMLESVSRNFYEGMAGIILSGSGSCHFHEGHSRL